MTVSDNLCYHQGESVQDKDPVTHHFFYRFYSPDDRTISLTIHKSDDDKPSIRPDDSVQKLCGIQCEIDIPWEDMREITDANGKLLSCRKVNHLALSMSFGGAPKWTLKAGGQTTEQLADVKYS